MSRAKKSVVILAVLAVISMVGCFIAVNSTLFLNSKLDRLSENDLPKVFVESDGVVCCRMKADDFRFTLPLGAVAMSPQLLSGGFDTVEGTVEAHFQDGVTISSEEYQKLVRKELQAGGWIIVKSIPSSQALLLSFSYFGDK